MGQALLTTHHGEDESDALFACAERVTRVEIRIEPDNHDRLFVVHFENQRPISMRVAAVDLGVILHHLAEAIAKSLN